jgi:hypothetical protein
MEDLMLPAIVGASEFKDRAAPDRAALVGCSIEISGSVHNQVGFWICAVDTAGEGILEKTFSAPTAGREEGNIIRRSASSVNLQTIADDLMNSPMNCSYPARCSRHAM